MPAKTNRKPTPRKGTKPRRAPNGRFKGQPRTISETVMPEEYAPATEAPREAVEKPALAAPETDAQKRVVNVESPSGYFYTLTYTSEPRPWYRQLWEAFTGWLR